MQGEHYCKDHQGNTSHYADHNCVMCKLAIRVEQLKEALRENDFLFMKLDEAMAPPERLAEDAVAVGGFVSTLDLTETASQIVERAIRNMKAQKEKSMGKLPIECSARLTEIHQRADRLFEMFVNGNRGDVSQELLNMEPKTALAVLSVMMVATNEDARASFTRYFTETA